MVKIGIELESKEAFNLDLSILVDTRMLVQANSGGGKSYILRKILEETHGKVQQIVLDLEGEFSTLREKYDYLLIGKGGDIPAHIKTAEVLAKKLLELNVSAIIDLYELKQHERILFVKRILDSMINAPKELWHPCIVVVDEAHIFAPEKGQSEAMGSVIDLCTRGRKRGYCAILATQRLSKLHKDAAAELNNKLIGRTGLDIDMKRASEELGFITKQDMLKLRDLNPGEFFAFGPALSKKIVHIQIGTVKTSHPKVGSRQLVKTLPPTDKIKKTLAKLVDLPLQADEELRTIEDYKQKIRELKLATHHLPKIDPGAIEASRKKGFEQGWGESLRQAVKEKKFLLAQLEEKENFLQKINSLSSKGMIAKTISSLPVQSVQRQTPPIAMIVGSAHIVPKSFSENEDRKLRKGAMSMLKAVAMFHPRSVTKNQIAALSGLSFKSGTFNTYLSELKSSSWIVESRGEFNITDEGLNAVGDVPELPTDPEELIKMWAGKFRAGAGKMLKFLAEKYPEEVSKDDIGEATSMSVTSGTFNTYLSELRRNGLIDVQGSMVKARKELFLEE